MIPFDPIVFAVISTIALAASFYYGRYKGALHGTEIGINYTMMFFATKLSEDDMIKYAKQFPDYVKTVINGDNGDNGDD